MPTSPASLHWGFGLVKLGVSSNTQSPYWSFKAYCKLHSNHKYCWQVHNVMFSAHRTLQHVNKGLELPVGPEQIENVCNQLIDC